MRDGAAIHYQRALVKIIIFTKAGTISDKGQPAKLRALVVSNACEIAALVFITNGKYCTTDSP